ncbi:hypothetical protein V8G69_08130 [Gaetbulibacter sp. M235]|uniref:hypothetical protein n=1 Tax=Gaetbulibacter sp. M235 TaxID=3126510 RepID=UPI00374F71F5
MTKIKYLLILLFLVYCQSLVSQTVEIQGKIKSSVDVENIHVINKTAKAYTITSKIGDFVIKAKLNDTIVFSSIQTQLKAIVVDEEIINKKTIEVNLEEQVNQLDEVTVGKILTGDLLSDINNTEGEPPINFFDVGIPGYTGKPATQSERRLSEAGEFKPKMLLGLLGGGLPLNPILNGISGRTKMLKQRVEIEAKEELMYSIKSRLSKDFLMSNPLEDDMVMDFFYFCADDENFVKHCKNQTDFNILIFLRMKYRQYLENLKTTKD